ncbi:hypothetical protein PAXRUDRAFT_18390 [Paxillus rubicundulus Ve08.2h10]|uniref:Uncharacterized protein n=1 Tax=Paxillus rubicundulus Ve08.2h10 TaxID=930991 RepID=A0A0D0BYC9_9AGAM|nr:hypothetical protein PAXRUDRAFT_18390 [Paxillus rubicundulus Ve08.2h10]
MSDLVVDYIMNRFREELARDSKCERAIPSRFIPTFAICQADRIVHALVAAYDNQVTVDIDTRCIAHDFTPNELGKDIEREHSLLEKYDPSPERMISEPTLAHNSLDEMWDSLAHIEVQLKRSITPLADNKWQTTGSLFQEDASVKGSIKLSPAWFQQGCKGNNHVPKVSALLKDFNPCSIGACAWLNAITIPNAVLSRALAIMHPDLDKEIA